MHQLALQSRLYATRGEMSKGSSGLRGWLNKQTRVTRPRRCIATRKECGKTWNCYEHAFECRLVKGRPRTIQVADWRWVRFDELDDFAFAVTDRKIIQALKTFRKL